MRAASLNSASWTTALRAEVVDPVTVHRAPWVLPVSRPPVQDGGVAVAGGRIAGIGRFRDLAARHAGAAVTEHPDAVLLPGLINAHIHLELSHLAFLAREPAPPGFTCWISRMLAARAKLAQDTDAVTRAARLALEGQQDQGVAAVADISNTGLTRDLTSAFTGRLLCFEEYLGLLPCETRPVLQALARADADRLCTGHAPYSTHAVLLRALKQRATRLGHIFPVHTAETAAENELLRHGTGEIQAFLEQRGFWDPNFQPMHAHGQGAVTWLYHHGLLDRSTLCVHCIHVTDREIDLLAETCAKVCLCPGSNRYLGAGRARADRFLARGLLPALGTDSLASNPEISLWREMAVLAAEHPGIAPGRILAMATLGGAAALGLDGRLGSLEPGRDAVVLAVVPDRVPRTAAAVEEGLVHGGAGRSVRRI